MEKYYPLSKSEEGIYISSLSEGDAYNLANTVNLKKKYDKEKIEKALNEVLKAHPYLNTILKTNDDGRVVKYIKDDDIHLELIKCDKVEINSLPYDLLNNHLYRFKLYQVKDEYILYFDFHHLIMDGSSIKIFIDDLFLALEGKPLIKETSNANDFALEEQKDLASDKYITAKAYYEKLVGDVECDSCLVEDKKDEVISYKNLRKELHISNKDVKKLTSKLGIKTSSFFLGAFAYLLSKYNMEDKALFLTVNNGRNEEVKHSFGSYVKTYPLYIEYDEGTSVSNLLKKINEENILNVKNNIYPFSDLNKDLGVSSDVLFSYQGEYFYKGTLDNEEVHITPLLRRDGKEKLSVELHRDNDNFIIWIEYRSDLYYEETIEQFYTLFDTVLKELLNKELLKDIDLVSKEELDLLESFNVIDTPYLEEGKTIIDDFENVARKFPNHPCVVFKDKEYSYQEVDDITNRIAN